MAKRNQNPYTRIFHAAGYSLQGLRAAFTHEQAFRQEFLVLLLVIPAALYLGETGTEYALLIGSWILVIIVELLNSAIEAVVDRIGDEHHQLAGRAKDLGSAAVFISISLSIFVWLSVLLL
jgi:diacylglycerol kinase (ATP)